MKNKTPPKKRVRSPRAPAVPAVLKVPLALLKEMRSTGLFTNEHIANLYKDLWKMASTMQITVGVPNEIVGLPGFMKLSKNDATELVPVSNIQASSLTPNFSTVRSFFLTGRQKHPKYPDWISAEEIGELVGLSADLVKKHIGDYCAGLGGDLPNNVATRLVEERGEYFKGVQSMVDDVHLPSHVNHLVGGVAVWFMMKDGKIVWRNYWSPMSVADILKLIPEAKKRIVEGVASAPVPWVKPETTA